MFNGNKEKNNKYALLNCPLLKILLYIATKAKQSTHACPSMLST